MRILNKGLTNYIRDSRNAVIKHATFRGHINMPRLEIEKIYFMKYINLESTMKNPIIRGRPDLS